MELESTYSQRGVSSDKGEVKEAIKNLEKSIYPNSFCKITADGTQTNCNISHADGAGTKTILAYLYWRETGDLSVWACVAIDSIVMNLDDVLCSGVISEKIFMTMTIDRNKFLIPGEVLAVIINAANDFIQFLNKSFGFNIVFSGGETADVGDVVRTITINANMSITMRRSRVINPTFSAGQVIVSLASFGKATYESQYNSGIRSNGVTDIRHELLAHYYADKYPEVVDPFMPGHLVYRGKHMLHESIVVPGVSEVIPSFGKFLLSPTRTYAPVIKKFIETIGKRSRIGGIFHCSGGGQTKIKSFLSDDCGLKIMKNNLFPMPHLFTTIQSDINYEMQNMFPTFNCGGGADILLFPDDAAILMDVAASFNVDSRISGIIKERKSGDHKLEITYEDQTYLY